MLPPLRSARVLPALTVTCAALAGCSREDGHERSGTRRSPSSGVAAAERVEIAAVAPLPDVHPTLPAYRPGVVANGGSVAGTVLVDGAGAVSGGDPTPAPPGAPACGGRGASRRATDVAGAVVWLEGVQAGKRFGRDRRYELLIDTCGLRPQALPAVAGGTLNVHAVQAVRGRFRFARADARDAGRVVLRTTFSDRGQVVPDERVLASAGAVEVKGETQPWLRAWVVAFDHPYFVAAGDAGAFALTDVPPGTYRLVVWHERLGRTAQTVTVAAGRTLSTTVRLRAPAPAPATARGD